MVKIKIEEEKEKNGSYWIPIHGGGQKFFVVFDKDTNKSIRTGELDERGVLKVNLDFEGKVGVEQV